RLLSCTVAHELIIRNVNEIIISFNVFIFMSLFKMPANGLGICDGTAFENRQPKICTKVDSSTNVQLLPSVVLLQIPC
ncbi:hypothetical protein PG270_09825, partial [Riemerella anatipestifer]|nr:hypothetical protein [Riemerella anatipestifer]